MSKSLFDLEVGQEGVLSNLKEVPGTEGILKSLLDMGFLPGMKIRVVAKFKSQGKLVVKLGLVELALRKIEADLIELGDTK
ncbi:iron transporter FeoA [Leptospira perolatii]|uniref:Iron transporter FeoA n=1 Tax=Leptospira perolatii TaxID=2023191 RepID=A0A2M9ZMR4_9LEPT|nr:FeoA domain-containing protein [Leptospira perolatii]PJZ70055.1 iron transporter FeoA [Leptospira perolatii]PJZ73243.1 iron transporter FeoA [Leptospira perolatii]